MLRSLEQFYVKIFKTKPDTRPIPVADGWAGADMRVFPLLISADGQNRPSDQWMDQRTDKASYVSATKKVDEKNDKGGNE